MVAICFLPRRVRQHERAEGLQPFALRLGRERKHVNKVFAFPVRSIRLDKVRNRYKLRLPICDVYAGRPFISVVAGRVAEHDALVNKAFVFDVALGAAYFDPAIGTLQINLLFELDVDIHFFPFPLLLNPLRLIKHLLILQAKQLQLLVTRDCHDMPVIRAPHRLNRHIFEAGLDLDTGLRTVRIRIIGYDTVRILLANRVEPELCTVTLKIGVDEDGCGVCFG